MVQYLLDLYSHHEHEHIFACGVCIKLVRLDLSQNRILHFLSSFPLFMLLSPTAVQQLDNPCQGNLIRAHQKNFRPPSIRMIDSG